MVARQSPGTWATLSGELEGMGWQNLGKLQQQHEEEDVAWPTGLCFSLLDLLKSLILRKVLMWKMTTTCSSRQ